MSKTPEFSSQLAADAHFAHTGIAGTVAAPDTQTFVEMMQEQWDAAPIEAESNNDKATVTDD